MPYIDGISAGFKRTDTSHAAADDVRRKAETIRKRVMRQLTLSHPDPLSSEEIAHLLDLPYESVQPRLAELRNAGKVIDSGVRRESRFGKRIIAWALTAPGGVA